MRIAKTTIVLFAFWCVVAGVRGWPDVLVGAIASLALARWAGAFLFPHAEPFFSALRLARLPGFVALHARRIWASAVHVLRVVLDPRLPIEPVVVVQRVAFDLDAARVAYANATTITPGTLTLDVDGDTFVVHCLDRAFAAELETGALARDVVRLFERRAP